MTLAELNAVLSAVEPAARLVPAYLVRRVIRRHRRIGGFGREVPHEHGYVISRQELGRWVSPEELGLGSAADEIPESVLLLAAPADDDLQEWSGDEAMARLWRQLFQLRVFAAVEALRSRGDLPASALRERFHRVGQSEADEIRSTLRKERLSLPPLPGESRDEVAWTSFVETWADLSAFEPGEIARTFPSLAGRRSEIDALLAIDVEVDQLLSASRPPGAPDLEVARSILEPAEPTPAAPAPRAPASEAAQSRLLAAAERARAKGNLVRAAILSWRAGAKERAEADLRAIGGRLETLLGRPRPDAEAWRAALAPLLDRVSSIVSPAARLLYDLQKACVDDEREVHRVDLVEWALSLGRRPIRRPLPSLREVRVARHLQRAAHRLASLRLAAPHAARLHEMLQAAASEREARMRTALRPLLAVPLAAATPESTTHVERVARAKAVEELLDRLVEKGALSFPFVRDAVSRNHAKLADLRFPGDLWRDALLRIDRDLAAPMEGVYRRAEFYRRWLQKLSGVLFGVSIGRFFTRFLLLPVAGAYIALEGLQHTIGLIIEKLAHVEVELVNVPALASLGLFTLGLVNAAWFRAGTLLVLKGIGRGLRAVFITAPRWVLDRPWLRAFFESAVWRAFSDWLLKPALVAAGPSAATWLFDLAPEIRWSLCAGLLTSLSVLLNTPVGHRLEEAATDGLVRARRWLAYRFFPALIEWILAVFRALLEGLERVLYTVDEWLRFRPGDRPLGIAIKAALGLPWGALSYVLRFYVNVMLEPKYNPVKHFPVVTVGHKIILPISFTLIEGLSQPLMFLGPTAAKAIAGTTVFLLPGLFGFLAWELKENWRLYRRNRASHLRPAVVGSHGENAVRLLRPGFHSGTVPKIFARLRRASRRRVGPPRERALHRQEEALHHVETAVRRLVERDLVALLPGGSVGLTGVTLCSNRIQARLGIGAAGSEVTISLEEQSGWLVGGLLSGERLERWPPELRRAFETALPGFYHLAGVDLVREEIRRLLSGAPPYDIADEGLVVWPGTSYGSEVVYPLVDRPMLAPQVSHPGPGVETLGPLRRVDLFFGLRPLPWERWVQAWPEGRT
jgi:hypothetical protein